LGQTGTDHNEPGTFLLSWRQMLATAGKAKQHVLMAYLLVSGLRQ
jgi:hypothetical protein